MAINLDDLETKAIKVGLELLLDKIEGALRQRPFWGRRRTTRIVETFGARLDDLVLNLQPCFTLGEPTSILQVFYESTPSRDESWNRVHSVLSVLGAWFRAWDKMRQAIGPHRTSGVLIEQIRSLNDFLIYTGLILPEVGKPIHGLPQDQPAYVLYKATADRYNHFLTEYEALLRRLPEEVGVLDPPIMGKEHFFIRL